MSIAASAVLVKLSISTWTANKIDRVQTDRVLADNNASNKAAQVRKNLMAGTQKVKDIMDFGRTGATACCQPACSSTTRPR